MYDELIGRWRSRDPLEVKYPFASTYSFALNTPIQAYDPDGKLVIFINGQWGRVTGACCGGSMDYWSYSGGKGDYAQEVMDRIGDHNARFYDGASGGFWGNTFPRSFLMDTPWSNYDKDYRYEHGYETGKKEAADIIAKLQRDPNNENKITESIKFVTNSMGTAHERGFSQALTDYVNSYNEGVEQYNQLQDFIANRKPGYKPDYKEKLTGFNIESTVDIAPFQGNQLTADPNAKSSYHMISPLDIVAGYDRARIPGSTELGKGGSHYNAKGAHHASFFDPKYMPRSQNNGSGRSVKEENPTNKK
jgi:hypothetical protein